MTTPEKHAASGPRTSGRKVAFGLLALIGLIVATAITFWWNTREPHGPILSMAAVSEHSVVIVRRGFAQRDYVHIVSRDLRQKAQRWSIALFSMQVGDHPVVSNGKAAIRVRDANGKPEVHAFDIEAGRFSFRAAAVDPIQNERLVVAEDAAGAHMVVAYGAPISRLFLIDVASGAVSFERALVAGTSRLRVGLGTSAAFVEGQDGHVIRVPIDGGADMDLGLGSVCVADGLAHVLSPDGSLRVFGPEAQPITSAVLEAVGDRARLAACAGDEGRTLLVLDAPHGATKTALFIRENGAVTRTLDVPQALAEGFGSAHGLRTSRVYVLPFEDGYLRVVSARGTARALYRVRNAQAPLSVITLEGIAVLPMGERVLVFRDGTPHLLHIDAEEGSSVLADADRAGGTLFLAVEREIVALDARTLALREHTGDVRVGEDEISTVLVRATTP